MDLHFLIFLFPAGVVMCFRTLKDEHVFVIIYAVVASYFAGVLVRLMLTLTPVVSVSAAVALSSLIDTWTPPNQMLKTTRVTPRVLTPPEQHLLRHPLHPQPKTSELNSARRPLQDQHVPLSPLASKSRPPDHTALSPSGSPQSAPILTLPPPPHRLASPLSSSPTRAATNTLSRALSLASTADMLTDFILGVSLRPGGVKFEPSSFKLTHEMLVSTVQLMLGIGLPSFIGEPTMKHLKDRFALGLNERQAAEWMMETIRDAHKNARSTAYDEFQRVRNFCLRSSTFSYDLLRPKW
ncbi:hypothetical protein EDD22DRAFT_997808 [Suillus occidentalis]|nr:hypothetical protein EDD22DRAFT_997808 [Suillus occidentalis]